MEFPVRGSKKTGDRAFGGKSFRTITGADLYGTDQIVGYSGFLIELLWIKEGE